MLFTSLIIGALHAVLDFAEHGIDRREYGQIHAAVAAAGPQRLVPEPRSGGAEKAGEPVAENDGVVEVALGKARCLGLALASRLAQAQIDRVPLVAARQRGDEGHFVQ